jgi:hypothetical protein
VELLLLIVALILVALAFFGVHPDGFNLFYASFFFFLVSLIWGARADFPRRRRP